MIAQRRAKLVQIETGPLGISFVRGIDQTDGLVAQLLPAFGVCRDLSMPDNFVAALQTKKRFSDFISAEMRLPKKAFSRTNPRSEISERTQRSTSSGATARVAQ